MMNITLQKNIGKGRIQNGGYTLLFAVLVSSLVLAVGISILTINKKELLLTASARDSASAFYSADGGLECAIQADSPRTGSDTFATGDTDNTGNLGASCPNGTFLNKLFPSFPTADPLSTPVSFSFDVQFGTYVPNGPCAHVTVVKTVNAFGNAKTIVNSRGYNLGWSSGSGCVIGGVKKVERAIEYSY